MSKPLAKAKCVLETHRISNTPALSLQSIAKSENIKCVFSDFPDDKWLAGMLLYKGEKRKIIINTHIDNIGRINFTLAHELGHYFMEHPPSYSKDGQSGFRCTSEDIEKESKPREVEANNFAVELLMPEDNFRLSMAGAPIDFTLINSLSKEYMVSKQACSYRIISFTQAPCVIIRTRGIYIVSVAASRSAKGFLRQMDSLPTDTIAYSTITENPWRKDFVSIESERWLCRKIPGDLILECTHIHRESGTAMTILKW